MKRTFVVGALAAGAVLLPQVALAADGINAAAGIIVLAGWLQAIFYGALLIGIIMFVLSLWREQYAMAGGALFLIFGGAVGSNPTTARDLLFPNAALGAEIEPGQIVRPLLTNAR